MEIIANAMQTVTSNNNVLFTDTIVDPCNIITHRNGSGQIKVYPLPNKCFTKFKITFGGNIAVPSDRTAGAISLAIAVDGEPDMASTMTVTPTVAGAFFNVSSSIYIYVRRNSSATVTIKNITDSEINVQNANLIVTVG